MLELGHPKFRTVLDTRLAHVQVRVRDSGARFESQGGIHAREGVRWSTNRSMRSHRLW